MSDAELDELRQAVHCGLVLERAGWKVDAPASSRSAVKYRRGPAEIIIVTHQGKGWFDAVSDKRGDVLTLVQHLQGGTLGHARVALRPLAGISPTFEATPRSAVEPGSLDAPTQWRTGSVLRAGSAGWKYLTNDRALPVDTVARAAEAGRLREGIRGTVWAAHTNASAEITGWEMRGPEYKGFSAGGRKGVFSIGASPPTATTLVITEAAIDALSAAAIDQWRPGTSYLSTGGGFGPLTRAALVAVVRPGTRLVAATDRGTGGEILAERLARIAAETGAEFVRRPPPTAIDWNAELQARRPPRAAPRR